MNPRRLIEKFHKNHLLRTVRISLGLALYFNRCSDSNILLYWIIWPDAMTTQQPWTILQSRQALGPTQPPVQWVLGTLSPGIKRQGREADHSPPTSTEVKKMVIYTSTSPYFFMAQCLLSKAQRQVYLYLLSSYFWKQPFSEVRNSLGKHYNDVFK
jgi:hypothetical protein